MIRDWLFFVLRAFAAFNPRRARIKSSSKSSFRFLATTFALFSSSVLFAGASEGLVQSPLVHEGNVFMFSAGPHLNKPACATTGFATWAIKLDNETGKHMMTLVLAAHAQGKRVHVEGTNHCNAWGNREQPFYAFMVD